MPAGRAHSDAERGVAGHGAAVPRGQDRDAGRDPPRGRFGRMFPDLAACSASVDALHALADSMKRRESSGDNTEIPAGFTYLGQFIDHDITFDPTSLHDRRRDPHALENFRTPRFDLDSVYGSGPVVQPFLYDWKEYDPPGVKLLVGHNAIDGTDDLPRNQQGRAVIADARNDEHRIIAQLHLLFVRFHNAVVDHLKSKKVPDEKLLGEAQELTRWHYQWIIVHEFLPKILGEDLAEVDREHFKWQREPFIPVEFSAAAYRFGHSMIRDAYGIRRRPEGGEVQHAIPLFPQLAGFTWLPRRLTIDWERFFMLPGVKREPQASFQIDTAIASPLLHLPEGDAELPRRNLLRGHKLELPSGQDVACAMHRPRLTEQQLQLGDVKNTRLRAELLASTPLWYYILAEAESEHGDSGAHLGPVGGRIVAEVFIGLLEGDPCSYLRRDPGWHPSDLGRSFDMGRLVTFVEESEARRRNLGRS